MEQTKRKRKSFGKIEIEVYHDWDSLIFWQSMNWRNFTWIRIDTETNNYSKYLELDLALLGFHFNLDWFRCTCE
jgi:hypothetical protein